MKNTFVLTLIGPDRPGIVDDLSAAIADNNGNWLESRLCNLAGQFAGVLLVECSQKNQDTLRKALEALEVDGMKIQIVSGGNSTVNSKQAKIELDISGPDHPGIVQDISHYLAKCGINIVELASRYEESAMSGGYIFHSRITATISNSQSIDEIANDLNELAVSLNVDIVLDDLKGTSTRV